MSSHLYKKRKGGQPPVLRSFAVRPLVMLGQSSLPVFCIHLLCVFFALTIMKNDPVLGGWKAIAVILASLAALFVTAKIANKRRAKAAENRGIGSEVATAWRAGYKARLAKENAA